MGSARRARRGARRARISGCAALRRYDHRPPCVHGGCAPLPRRYDTARKSVSTITAGRTDAGVHALEQIVHFDTDIKRAEFSWVRGLNAFLPDSVAVQWAHAVPDAFHARFSAVERCYDYVLYIHRVRVPLLAGRAGWIHAPL